jgi:TRAP-type C4-dicarboxylate transport system permease small subunit
MRFSLRNFFTGLRQSFRFHYLWRGFFFDRAYANLVKASEKTQRLSSRLLIFYVLATAALIITNGISRIVTARALPWAEELASWLLMGICFIGSGIAIKKGLHVGITIIIELSPACVKKILVFAGNLFCTLFLLSLIAISFVSACGVSGEGVALKAPLAIPYMQVPISGVFILVQMLPFLAGPLLKDADPEKFLLTRIVPEELQ